MVEIELFACAKGDVLSVSVRPQERQTIVEVEADTAPLMEGDHVRCVFDGKPEYEIKKGDWVAISGSVGIEPYRDCKGYIHRDVVLRNCGFLEWMRK